MRTCGCAESGSEIKNPSEQEDIRQGHHCPGRGKLAVIGVGPGDLEHMSLRAYKVLRAADVIVGYKTYIELLNEVIEGKEIVSSGMKKEVERCALAVERALAGQYVALVSSGDPGIYGMAGLALELVEKQGAGDRLEVEIVPGISAANAAAASLGAPLMHDYAVISLSDLLTPWEIIEKRLEAAAAADFVTAIYNPVSTKRTEQIKRAREIFLKYRDSATPVGIVRNAKRGTEEVVKTDLEHFLEHPMDMFSLVIIGNPKTYLTSEYMITPRGYHI